MELVNQIQTNKTIEAIRLTVLKAQTIGISGHINPDGDSIGSLLSLGFGLEKLGKKVYMLSSEPVPQKYRMLPGSHRITSAIPDRLDVAIAVDCGGYDMLGSMRAAFQKAGTTIEIDHHPSRTPFADLTWVDTKAAAVGEIIFRFLRQLNIGLDENIAQNILTSIIVETNSFRIPHIRPQTFEICSQLMKAGADFYRLAEQILWIKKREATQLAGICMARAKTMCDGKLMWSMVSHKDLRVTGAQDSDIDPVVDKMQAIEGVEVAILFRQKNKNFLRVSFRSREGINVAHLAEKFGGGGHFTVAGCLVPNKKRIRRRILQHAQGYVLSAKPYVSTSPLKLHQKEKSSPIEFSSCIGKAGLG
ncbi:MAG: DHH family phosphoesterase [Chitinivibrionales bacterium]